MADSEFFRKTGRARGRHTAIGMGKRSKSGKMRFQQPTEGLWVGCRGLSKSRLWESRWVDRRDRGAKRRSEHRGIGFRSDSSPTSLLLVPNTHTAFGGPPWATGTHSATAPATIMPAAENATETRSKPRTGPDMSLTRSHIPPSPIPGTAHHITVMSC